MSNWQRTLYLQPEWDQACNGVLSIQEFSKVIADRLEALQPFVTDYVEEQRECLIEDFRAIASNPDATEDDFDGVLDELYTWGDISLDGGDPINGKKVCWVDRFTAPKHAEAAS